MPIYGVDYYGFIYLWYDRKHKMFCLGSHLGSLDDGYITSTGWMKQAYKKRKNDFKRRVLWWCPTRDKNLLHEQEQKWLDLIKDEELSTSKNVVTGKNRYYNMKKHARGGNGSANKGKSHTPWNKGMTTSDEVKKKMSTSLKGRVFSEEHRRKLSEAHRKKR